MVDGERVNAVTDAFDGDLTFGFIYAVELLRVRGRAGGRLSALMDLEFF